MTFVNSQTAVICVCLSIAFAYEMSMEEKEKTSSRQYPAVYEKAIPYALGLIALIFVMLLGVTIGILFHLF